MSAVTSVQTAMRFVAMARSDPTLRRQLERLEPGTGLEPVLSIASELGFSFTGDDLRQAHRHDWMLRRVHHLGDDRPAQSDASTAAVVNAPSSST
jgi:predicted ribosomally synthesized peptide with nif11-like leader